MGEAKRNADRIVKDRTNDLVRALGFEALGRIMNKTPVDTGRARANWNVSEGEEDPSTNPEATRKDVVPKKLEGQGRIRLLDFWEGDVLYVTNGLPYIQPLEDGHSGQAPKGMARVTVAELKPLADRIARKIRALRG